MAKRFVLLLLLAACGPNVEFQSQRLSMEPGNSIYGETDSWSLTEGIAVSLAIKPSDAHVTFVADDDSIVRVQETSRRGTFIVMPTLPGTTTLHARGDSQKTFTVSVTAQP